ncbi:MAG: hypothetical protein VW840_19165 [Gammaproteobacteria bacterium]
MQTRIAEVISEYSSQGIHRTGTDVDNQSAAWLLQKIESLGVSPAKTVFRFQRLNPLINQLSIGDLTITGVPLYDCTYTDNRGITGSIGELGSEADIGVIMALPFASSPGGQRIHSARLEAKHKAIIIVTDSRLPENGVALQNAEDFTDPFGPPVLQVSNEHWTELQTAMGSQVEANVVIHCEYVDATASNVEAKIKGSNPDLAPVVVMTPRSGWWANASERGGGIACFLEIVRSIKASSPRRDVIFTANTGHELGHTGLELFLHNNPGLIQDAHIWMHLGANFAAKHLSEVRLQYSDDEAVENLAPLLTASDLSPAVVTPMGERPLGEARNVFDGGGRYVSILGGNGLFHHPADQWPHAVDLELTTKWVRAFTQLAVKLSAN